MVIRVGVLRGGPSQEHGISLKTGEAVLANLPEKYAGKDILLSQNGEWIFEGQYSQPEKIFRSIDVVFNALHGYFGEDGKVQKILEIFSVPYTGSGVLASALGMNKFLAREAFKKSGLNVPRTILINKNEDQREAAKKIFNSLNPSWVVKPASSGSSVGVSIIHQFNDLADAIRRAFDFDQKILVEEYIKGKEVTCGILDDFRGQRYYSLPVIEIIPPAKNEFFNYEAKYSGETKEICPANLDSKIKKIIEDAARTAHEAIGCRHYSRADFIISQKPNKEPKIYILEINTLPGLTKESLLPKSLKAIGSSYEEFLSHLINLALK